MQRLNGDEPEPMPMPESLSPGIQRQNKPPALPGPRPEKSIPIIIVTPSSPSRTSPTEFHHLVFSPAPPRQSRGLFKPFASNSRRLRWIAVLLAVVGSTLLWHAWVLRTGKIGPAAVAWHTYIWERLEYMVGMLGLKSGEEE